MEAEWCVDETCPGKRGLLVRIASLSTTTRRPERTRETPGNPKFPDAGRDARRLVRRPRREVPRGRGHRVDGGRRQPVGPLQRQLQLRESYAVRVHDAAAQALREAPARSQALPKSLGLNLTFSFFI